MKQDAASHWKIKALGRDLAARLCDAGLGGRPLNEELSRRLAMGVMESFWIWVKRYYPRGDVGRASDEVITMESGWDAQDASWFVSRLVKHKLIDVHNRHRLIVHDLSEHAEDYVRKSLERAGIKTFIDGLPVRRDVTGRPRATPNGKSRLNRDSGETKSRQRGAESPPDLTSLNQPSLNQSSLNQPPPATPPRPPSEATAIGELTRLRETRGGKDRAAPIGPAAAAAARAAGSPEVVRALERFWPPREGDTARQLAGHPNATIERVFWLIHRSQRERMQKTPAHFIRAGIENGWDVDPEFLREQNERLRALRGSGAAP